MLGSAEIAVVPSLYEGFSIPAVEAMACATPLIATRGGALPEVVGTDGKTAVLVTPGDPAELADALGALLDDDARRSVARRRRPPPGRDVVHLAGGRRDDGRGLPRGDRARQAPSRRVAPRRAGRRGTDADGRLRAVPDRRGRPGARPRLRRRPTRLRALPPRCARRRVRPRRRRAGRRRQDVPRDGRGGRAAAPARPRRWCRATCSRCRSRTRRSTPSSPPRSSSTSPTTSAPWPRSRGSSARAARSR